MKPRLRWTEIELRAHDDDTYVPWRLACTIVLGALEKSATIIFVKKVSATKLAVLYAVDGALVTYTTPPAELHVALCALMTTLCGPIELEPGARGEFDLIRDDGTLVVAHAVCGANEWGPTVTIRLAAPPRVLN
jgi:hypothetical protein